MVHLLTLLRPLFAVIVAKISHLKTDGLPKTLQIDKISFINLKIISRSCKGEFLIIERYNSYLKILNALSDDTRLIIIKKLTLQEFCAYQLKEVRALDITQSSLSYHMKVLTDLGLVSTIRVENGYDIQ